MTATLAPAGGARAALLLPFALFLAILPFPGTVAVRLVCLFALAAIAAVGWWRQAAERPALACKPALAIWIALCGASLAYSAFPAYSLGEFKNEIGYTMLAFLSFLFVARDRATVETLLTALAAGFAVIGAWAAGAWVVHGFHWDESGRYGGIAVFSTYLVTAAPALFWLACAGRRPALRRIAWGLLLLAFLLALMTLQRAIWPTVAAEAAVVGAWRYRGGWFGRRGLMWAALCGVLIAAAFYATSSLRSVGPTVGADLMADSRLLVWRGIVEKIAEHPVIGAGFGRGTMGRAYPELIPPAYPLLSHPHNVFLNYAVGMGIPGLLALAALFFCLARAFWRLMRHTDKELALLGVCGVMLVVGVVTRNQFNDLFIRDMSLLYWALAGIFLGQASRRSGTPARA
ncbi:MAG: O-antigen ligase family protein [Rhodocyclaceae bacterium]|nr:O-antigen ligase family protein [Rhodocyclaceae bacterium]